jgi:membrane protein
MALRVIKASMGWLQRMVHDPMNELTRWQRFARFSYDLGRHGTTQLMESKAPLMAAALSFRTLFGLLPVLVVATVLARAMMGPQDFGDFLKDMVTRIIAAIGLQGARLNVEAADAPATASSSAPADAVVGGATLDEWFQSIAAEIPKINFTAISWVGVAVLMYSAISLMVTIENSFNTIYRAPQGRSWTKRVLIYWFVLTVSPLVLTATVFVDQVFQGLMTTFDGIPLIVGVAPKLWSFATTWLLIFAIYKFVPNASVAARPALSGAFLAALLMEIGKRTMGAYLENAVSLKQLYGQLGLVPLFMFWIYLMWIVLLFP